MEIKQLLLQQQLVAATRTGDMRKIEKTHEAFLWNCVGVFESFSNDGPNLAGEHEAEVLFPLN
jgi:hypothetical protein